MKLERIFILLLFVALPHLVSAQGTPDSMWICRDSVTLDELYYYQIGLCDTPAVNTGCWNETLNSPGVITMADTGDRWDSSYINFNYQFTNAKPGYAGFKIIWDMGISRFNVTSYDSMYFVHKGPLPGHKVHIIWGWGGECGGPVYYQDFGEFKSSAVWKKEAVVFPPGFVGRGIFELRMLIYNDSSVTTSPTSAPGCLKLDDICFIRAKLVVPAAPALVSPSNNATGVSATPAITWSSSFGAASYSLQMSPVSDFSNLTVNRNGFNATSFNASGLLNNTKYYWRLNATNTVGTSAWSATWNFTTTPGSSDIPVLVSPAPGATGVPVATQLAWHASTGTLSYGLQLSVASDFSTTVVNPANIADTFYNLPGLGTSSKYYWRVLANKAGGPTDWSPAWNFTTISPVPAAPSVMSPVSGAINIPIDPVMTWHAVAYAMSYKVQVSTTPDFIMLVKYMTVPADTSVIVTGLTNGTKYYSRVNATSTGGTGSWSTAIDFTTVASNVAVLRGQTRPLSFSCNGSSSTMRYSLPDECFVSLNYYDVRGAEVASFVNRVQKPGCYSLSIPLSTWARGTYIQIFRAGGFIKKDMVAVIR